jgi:hypothetical protein
MNPENHPLHADLCRGLDALALDRQHAGKLLDYLDLLVRWNKTYNLTAIRDPNDMNRPGPARHSTGHHPAGGFRQPR